MNISLYVCIYNWHRLNRISKSNHFIYNRNTRVYLIIWESKFFSYLSLIYKVLRYWINCKIEFRILLEEIDRKSISWLLTSAFRSISQYLSTENISISNSSMSWSWQVWLCAIARLFEKRHRTSCCPETRFPLSWSVRYCWTILCSVQYDSARLTRIGSVNIVSYEKKKKIYSSCYLQVSRKYYYLHEIHLNLSILSYIII